MSNLRYLILTKSKLWSCCFFSSGWGSSSCLTSLIDLPIIGGYWISDCLSMNVNPILKWLVFLHPPGICDRQGPLTRGTLFYSLYNFILTSASYASHCHILLYFVWVIFLGLFLLSNASFCAFSACSLLAHNGTIHW